MPLSWSVPRVAVVIPALNEEQAIGEVIGAIPAWVDDIVVVDNGSSDNTAEAARSHGARVVSEPERGYGAACLAGIAALDDPDIVVFLDGDNSDCPEEMELLVEPIIRDRADLVAGSRVLGERQPGALTPQARFGNRLACLLIRLLWKAAYTDLGPFRAIRAATLEGLDMRDRTYGWTVEMQIKAAARGIRVLEVATRYRVRIGKSKISGTLRGVAGAGSKILGTIFRLALEERRGGRPARARERVVIFTRYPEAGSAKTRLIPALGAQGAAQLQRRMTETVLEQVRGLAAVRRIRIDIRYAGGGRGKMRAWLGPDLPVHRQPEGDLGERMAAAFRYAFDAGSDRVVLIGTDAPGITADHLVKALSSLEKSDLVLGPALDGGYYLIGLRRPLPELFAGIPWGTATVLRQTLDTAAGLGIAATLLDPLPDVDRPEDLPHVPDDAGAFPD